jgi:hypothetical protein
VDLVAFISLSVVYIYVQSKSCYEGLFLSQYLCSWQPFIFILEHSAFIHSVFKHIAFMQDNPKIRLRLEGHADERGTREYNLALGENRALSVKQLLGFGDRIEVVSFTRMSEQNRITVALIMINAFQ